MMKPEAIVAFLGERVSLLEGFSRERLERLVAGSRSASFEANEALAHQGAEPAELCVLMSGTATVSAPGDGGVRQELGRLEAGGTFGEMALMTGDKLLADFIADTRCEALFVPVSLFRNEIASDPGAVQRISRTIAERFRLLLEDPSKAAAALRRSEDPYGLTLKGERPEKILVVNCGSSSVKYTFFDTADASRQARGLVERIGIAGTRHVYRGPRGDVKRELPTAGFAEAFGELLAALVDPERGVISGAGEVSVVAHRVVHGGERFTGATLITEGVLSEIEALSPLAPLHNPVNLAGIRELRRHLPAVPHVAVFDTSFHHTLPAYAYLYGLPYELYETKGVRRYGFHGMSHAYVSLRAAQFLGRRPGELELVSCHLGNGSSVCALDHGRSADTSMGFTPAEGLIMGTRCGDVDAGVLAFLERTEGLSASRSEEMLNRKSGLLGLSGISSDMREILEAAGAGQARAILALKAYCYRVRKYIGGYVAAMGGLDAVVFTGGIGEGSDVVRALALQGLGRMGIRLDEARNRGARGPGETVRISSDDSPVAVLVVPADEERMMAREALRAIGRSWLAQVVESRATQAFPIEVRPHHAHLSADHVAALFGEGHVLAGPSGASGGDPFAGRDRVSLSGPRGRIENVPVLGPAVAATQVEIAMTEQVRLGVHPPVRESGDIRDTPGCTLEGPAGRVTIERGVICALRHIHMAPADALRYGVRDKSFVRVRVAGDRELVFGGVLVNVGEQTALTMHIDTDEANAAHVGAGAQGRIVEIQEQN